MWPFDRKRKKEEAERKEEAQRQETLARLRQAAEERRPVVHVHGRTSIGPVMPPRQPESAAGRHPGFGAPYSTSRTAPADDMPLFYGAASAAGYDSSSDSCSSSSSDSGGGDSGGGCGGGD